MTAADWIAEATDVLDLVGDHPNTDSIEDREFRDKAPTVLHAALDALEAVLELHKPVDVWEIDPKNGTWVHRDDERVILTRLCRECTPEFVLEKVEDSEYTPVFHGVEVEWPCPTVTAITTALGVES